MQNSLRITKKPNQKIINFVFAVSLSIMQACSVGNGLNTSQEIPSSSQQTQSQNLGEACDNPLLPIKQGATWAYISTGGPNGTFAYTDTISEVRADGFTLTSQFSDLVRVQEWACEIDGLKALQVGSGTTAGISIQGITAEFTTSDITGISLPKEIVNGMQWSYGLKMFGTVAMPTEQQAQSSGTYSAIMQELGKEIITVPAGTFEAIKIQSNSSVDITATFEGIQVPIKFNGTSIIWYVPDIGYVKSVENGDFGGTVFSAVTELQTYIIP